jgi:tellurite resistance protein TerC
MEHPTAFWIGFHLLIAVLLAIDLIFFNRKNSEAGFKKACWLSAFWIAIALAFNLFVYFNLGRESALQFFTGYLVEKSLSLDNLFVFLLIFSHFQTPDAYQRKILFWGILGALVFRIAFILAGVALIEQFSWMLYLFGAILLISGIKFLLQKQKAENVTRGVLYRTISKMLPVAKTDGKGQFFLKEKGKSKVTLLFLALLMIECTDILMALDSIPAIFAITTDPFIIYTSNVFAILGLRALYFVLASGLKKLKYLKHGLAAILIFIGLKMMVGDFLLISLPVSLCVILGILGVTVLASIRRD